MSKPVTLVAIVAAALLTPAVASAQISGPSMAVSYADLDIGSSAGLAALNRRIRTAARQLCEPNLSVSMLERTQRRNCYRAAIASTQGQVELAVAQRQSPAFAGRSTISVATR